MLEDDSALDVFIFENMTLLEGMEDVLLDGEKTGSLDGEQINGVFRAMHTIKGSSAMMSYDGLSHLAHAAEDLFAKLRDGGVSGDSWGLVFELALKASDALKNDIMKLQDGGTPDGDFSALIDEIKTLLSSLSPAAVTESAHTESVAETLELDDDSGVFYKLKITFTADCQMENMRAFGVVNSIKPLCVKVAHIPEDLTDNAAALNIRKSGFIVYVRSSENPDTIKQIVSGAMFLDAVNIIPIPDDSEDLPQSIRRKTKPASASESVGNAPILRLETRQNFISVNVNKLDRLLDLVGEIVTAESMVEKSPDLQGLNLDIFSKSARQLRKLVGELQDVVMSVRMLPVSVVFQKMYRVVRDVSRHVGSDVRLQITGEETEVDKNVIDTLSDPLMHLIRNAVDHGIELPDRRAELGKPRTGVVTLGARQAGGDVIISVSDDGCGLDRESILRKAIDKGLIAPTQTELSDREVFALIFSPGLSTSKQVTEFSGRGVGMDVVKRNIENVGGLIYVDSEPDKGTTVEIHIPLTLSIVEGMRFSVGDLMFIAPILSIQESFRPDMETVFTDPDGSEMITIRGEVYPIVRLHELLGIEPRVRELQDGILVMISTEFQAFCLFVDRLIGEQQAVFKPLPPYLVKNAPSLKGIAGCAILGDGAICLVLDINNLLGE
ncbi:MAG: chemotaxis protein CheA [Oscillospiraceae bacterium]|jgi:two-component system chemotaxis sensor kinase CheA|nr:chemotaxis protein CheA [Oscillospiraceae bacterium]